MDSANWLIMGGGIPPSISLKEKVDWQARTIICADSGANHAYLWKIVPDIICGDLDSIDAKIRGYYERQDVEFLTYPRDKDWTDTELAISIALSRGAKDLVFVGLDGGRTDHFFTNYLLIASLSSKARMRILNEQGCTYFLNERFHSLRLEGIQGKNISAIPLTSCQGIFYEGMKYPLEDETLALGSSRGMSNVALEETVSIRFASGLLMINVNE
ncbi:thiamine diphosphokinase [Clostridia bacterium]|nr:thiamine diphosphokinase [Clostridia bacterium]